MANIRVDVDGIITDGQSVTFRAPCDCSEIEGLKIYYIKDKVRVGELFTMKDSRVQNLSTVNNLFAAGAYVTVVLDTVNKRAFLQNAATSGYIEEKVTPVDNLESDRADLPLSAKQGKVLFQSVSDGKSLVASAITDKGVTTAEDATFAVMADNIASISCVKIAEPSCSSPETNYPSFTAKKGKLYVVTIACPGVTNNSYLNSGADQLYKKTTYRSCGSGLYVHNYLVRATATTVTFYGACASGTYPNISWYQIEA